MGPLRGRFLSSSSILLSSSYSSYHAFSAPHSSPSIAVTVSSSSRQSSQEAMRMFQRLMTPSFGVESFSGMLCDLKIIHQRSAYLESPPPL